MSKKLYILLALGCLDLPDDHRGEVRVRIPYAESGNSIQGVGKMALEIGLIRGEEMKWDIEATMNDNRLMEMYKTITTVK